MSIRKIALLPLSRLRIKRSKMMRPWLRRFCDQFRSLYQKWFHLFIYGAA